MFEVGDRVRAVRKFQTGVLEGEYGTIVDVWETGVSVYWDDYKSNRHTCEGKVPSIWVSLIQTWCPYQLKHCLEVNHGV